MAVLPPRSYANDEEARLAAALDSLADKMLAVTDAACRLRSAPGEAKRQRALMRTHLEQAAHAGLAALLFTQAGPTEAKEGV